MSRKVAHIDPIAIALEKKRLREAEEEARRPQNTVSPSGGQSPTAPLTTPVAPERDFNKRANSLDRDALPSGHFPGSRKRIYDALYLRTCGAIKPTHSVRTTKRDLLEWLGVKNRKTLDAHTRYLTAKGLLERKWELGNTDGYLFEVRLPEEAVPEPYGRLKSAAEQVPVEGFTRDLSATHVSVVVPAIRIGSRWPHCH